VVGRRDDDGVDVLAVEHAAEIGVDLRAAAGHLPRLVGRRTKGVADGADLRVGLLQKIREVHAAHAAQPIIAIPTRSLGADVCAKEEEASVTPLEFRRKVRLCTALAYCRAISVISRTAVVWRKFIRKPILDLGGYE